MSLSPNASANIWLNLDGNGIRFNANGVIQYVLIAAILFTLSISSGWLTRNRQRWRDTIMMAVVLSVARWRTIFDLLSRLNPSEGYIYAVAVVSLQASIAFQKARSLQRESQMRSRVEDKLHPLPPLIFQCRTTHTRFFPTKHSFAYSYLLVGIPIGWNGSAGSLISTELSETRTWYSVHSDDYLARGMDVGGLQSKLHAYLTSQGFPSDKYPYAYLVTAPRFLGFSFNPVSFWYLYDENKVLAAMILEVNNTFDERRMYLMENRPGQSNSGRGFTNEWPKDFHVSPFNDRDGSYSLTAKDPLEASEGFQIDNNIVLRSDDGKAKIVARVFSTEAAVNPAKLSLSQTWLFVARWWWVGFMTNPRILREARILWVKKLQVFYRPEVFATSIGRPESTEEVKLEPVFRAHLQYLMNTSSEPLNIDYISAAGHDRGRTVHLRATNGISSSISLQMKVLTPAFYAEVAKAKSVVEAFENYCFNPDAGMRMVEVSDIPKLRHILQISLGLQRDSATVSLSTCSHILLRQGSVWKAVWHLLVSRGKIGSSGALPSDLDVFVQANDSTRHHEYSSLATKLLLADKFALGFMPLLNFYATILWCGLGYHLLGLITALLEQPWQATVSLRYITVITIFHYLRGRWIGPMTTAHDVVKR